jgi:hypothetical protein
VSPAETLQVVARLYDELHARRAEAAAAYLAAEHLAPEEYHRGYRDALDEALGVLDGLCEQVGR